MNKNKYNNNTYHNLLSFCFQCWTAWCRAGAPGRPATASAALGRKLVRASWSARPRTAASTVHSWCSIVAARAQSAIIAIPSLRLKVSSVIFVFS